MPDKSPPKPPKKEPKLIGWECPQCYAQNFTEAPREGFIPKCKRCGKPFQARD